MRRDESELRVWQKAYCLCLEIYNLAKTFPEDEQYGLTSQIKRAAIAGPLSIAEGYGRKTVGK